ncbi:hypothetical protein VOLCADRAFT_93895 [Volvox carteri f. nagariensis]|uniref:CUE domain-containing protein n=1 Tax=Volvox carteri f. nagariensis TaxID=3068 RepID=D8U3C7_VOLCA|nr:uncharacterized protein VOLCADRAFT_93895 [Volvox carteri f. nagariensis]EFJ45729.1 hypothetical protein VOLCADRAFT_93895 [Volvox carteri f. nagariensis]|eukprot:XP_002953130.1 hypothetical protein VOLCADRAFT_93895 [Volvox carteri f. nagariensis]
MADPGESQASENKASVNLVELFQTGENGIERRRTENLFKQLDERQLTEDEQAIIQQRVELQRKMFQEYERREKQRKLRELQEVCPDLDEEAARRALELCNWREEAAAEKISSDQAFLRRVLSGGVGGPGTGAAAEYAPAPRRDRPRSSSRAAVGPRPRLVDPSQVGAVFVGRFKSRLGPHQISAMGRQQQPQQQQTRRAGIAAAAGSNHGQAGAAAAGSPATATAASGGGAGGRGARGDDANAVMTPRLGAAKYDPHHHQQLQEGEDGDGKGADGDVEMADVGTAMESDALGEEGPGGGADGEQQQEGGMAGATIVADGGESETEAEEYEGEHEGVEVEDPNSADYSDNELQYEDDVLPPVMSPLLAGKRGRRVSEADGEEHDVHQSAGLAADAAATAMPVEIGSAEGRRSAEPSGSGPASGGRAAMTATAQQPLQQGHELQGPHDLNVSGALAAAAATAAITCEDEEVNSPARRAHAAAAAAAAVTATVAAATTSADQPMALAAHRPRRAKADLAAAIRHAAAVDEDSDEGEAKEGGRRAGGSETASDGGDSDFELGSGGGGRRGAAASYGATSSSNPAFPGISGHPHLVTLVHFSVDRSGSAPTTGIQRNLPDQWQRLNSIPGAAAGARRQQQPRKRTASGGGAGGTAATRATRQRAAAAVAMAAAAAAPQLRPMEAPTAAADAGAAAASAEVTDGGGAGPSGRGGADEAAAAAVMPTAAMAAANVPCEDDSEATMTEEESPGGRTKRRAKSKKGKGGYIFPAGFRAQTLFRSSVDLDSLTLHTCEILGECGQYWPAPTFVVTAADRPDEPLVAKSCTGCWTAVLRRINGEIEGRRAAGEDLPPPPKTAIAGPEYFGLNQPEICAAIEALDVERKCTTYWWSAVTRAERYRKRCEEAGEDAAALLEQSLRDNPLPGFLDPITLEPVVNPAISPYGHVMGLATWKAVLAENRRCPFTKQPLKVEALTVLTKNNIERYRSRIIQQ